VKKPSVTKSHQKAQKVKRKKPAKIDFGFLPTLGVGP